MGVNITTIVYLRVLIIEIGSTIVLMVVEAQGLHYPNIDGYESHHEDLVGAQPPSYCSFALHLVGEVVILAAHDCSSLSPETSYPAMCQNWFPDLLDCISKLGDLEFPTVDGSEIRRSPVEVGNLSQNLLFFFTSQVVFSPDFERTINSSNWSFHEKKIETRPPWVFHPFATFAGASCGCHGPN